MSAERPPIVAAEPKNIMAAADALRQGRLVAFPTETVYGLGCDATNERAVAKVFEAKDRPRFNPLIVHVAERDAAEAAVRFNERAHALADRFWPGALTLVLPRRNDRISLLVSAGLDTVAVRQPDHPVALALLGECPFPVAAPSANRSGRISPTAAGHVALGLPAADAGGPEMVLDGGPCEVGLESTVVDLATDPPALLRPGGVTKEDVEAVIGPIQVVITGDGGAARSPGLQARHYAPMLPLRPDADTAGDGEALLGFGAQAPADAMNLSPSGDLAEAAANLFAMIRALDGPPFTGIAVMPVPEHGLGRAINDRLRRAAAAGTDTDEPAS